MPCFDRLRGLRCRPEECSDEDFAVPLGTKRFVQCPGLGVNLCKLVFEQFISRVERQNLNPTAVRLVALNVRGHAGNGREIKG